MTKLYTIGYGRTTWPDFLQRLRDADISCIIDIRRYGSKSRNGKAFWQGCGPPGERWMGDKLFEAAIEYLSVPDLANDIGGRLATFRDWCNIAFERRNGYIYAAFCKLGNLLEEMKGGNVCLLCCERDYRRCHRRIVAEVVASELGLEVVHL